MSGGAPARLSRAERREITRQRLLDAAAEVFTDHGFDGAAIDDVAARAGYTRGAFYSNFADKTDLLVQLCERRIEAFAADELPDVLARTPDERLGWVADWLAEQVPPLEILLAIELARRRDHDPEVAATLDRVVTTLLGAIDDLMAVEGSTLAELPDVERRDRALAVLAGVTGASLLRHLGVDTGPRTLALLLDGVIGPHEGPAA
jgi:AcrR family transcriptional regulator